jgi:hypothetical protein
MSLLINSQRLIRENLKQALHARMEYAMLFGEAASADFRWLVRNFVSRLSFADSPGATGVRR